jgi:hypothetical protein
VAPTAAEGGAGADIRAGLDISQEASPQLGSGLFKEGNFLPFPFFVIIFSWTGATDGGFGVVGNGIGASLEFHSRTAK